MPPRPQVRRLGGGISTGAGRGDRTGGEKIAGAARLSPHLLLFVSAAVIIPELPLPSPPATGITSCSSASLSLCYWGCPLRHLVPPRCRERVLIGSFLHEVNTRCGGWTGAEDRGGSSEVG